MKYAEFGYQTPPRLSESAMKDLIEIRQVLDPTKNSNLFRKFQEKYYHEIKERSLVQHNNVGNFMHLCDLNTAENRQLIRPLLKAYDGRPGFYYRKEGNGFFLKQHYRTGNPETIHMYCVILEATRLLDEIYQPTHREIEVYA